MHFHLTFDAHHLLARANTFTVIEMMSQKAFNLFKLGQKSVRSVDHLESPLPDYDRLTDANA